MLFPGHHAGLAGVVTGLCVAVLVLHAQTPPLLPQQGRIAVGDTYFDGAGAFKFGLVNAGATQVFWLNAPDTNGDGEPDAAVTLPVQRGLYSVLLGDTKQANMAPLGIAVFSQPEVYLRVWFDDGTHGFQRLEPDQRVVPPPFALRAADVPDGAITAAKLAPNALEALLTQLAALTAQVETLSNQVQALASAVVSGLPPGVPVLSPLAQDPALLANGFNSVLNQPAPGWTAGASAGAPAARSGHTAVWTGQEWLVWGGSLSGGQVSGQGAAYRADADAWQALPTFNAPAPRTDHTAVWTGQEMVIWGGFAGGAYLNTGARFDPASQTWTALPPAGAPAGRHGHVMVWTGSRVLVWGGRNASGLLNDGALYDPATDTWSALGVPGVPAARYWAGAVWTGTSLVVWGGGGETGELGDGARLAFDGAGNPVGWTPLSTTGAPSARAGHTVVWTGQHLLVWGGLNGSNYLGNGARYDPASDTWLPLATQDAPAPRRLHTALWTGNEMLILGGETTTGATATAYAYSPTRNTWRALSQAGTPPARVEATAAWTGTEALVFGGRAGGVPLAALYRLDPRPTWFFYLKP